jgi:hypothetical protein
MYFNVDILKELLPTENEGFVRWWCKLSILSVLATVVLPCAEIWLTLLKGAAAGSGLCVCVGYYIFAVIYGMYHSPNLMNHMYFVQKLDKYMSYEVYLVLDVGVHVVATICIYIAWYNHITVLSTLVAFVFHRYWSILNSNGTTMYLCGDHIYQNKPMPYWGWTVVYMGEAMVLVCSMFLGFWLQKNIM